MRPLSLPRRDRREGSECLPSVTRSSRGAIDTEDCPCNRVFRLFGLKMAFLGQFTLVGGYRLFLDLFEVGN